MKQRRDTELKAEAEKAAATCVEETKAKREAMVKRCEQYEKEYAQVYDFIKFVYFFIQGFEKIYYFLKIVNIFNKLTKEFDEKPKIFSLIPVAERTKIIYN